VQSFSDFTDPFSGRVDPRRLSWWLTLSEYFNIPHRLDVIFNAQPGEWHNIFHDLHSFALMREFLEVIDKVGVKRTRERVHQELARRIAFLRTGRLDGTCAKMQFRLMRMGYVELREMSREFDGVLGENGRETCPMCVVQRPFKGDSTAMRQ
jgi:hypothetical protein